MSPCTLCGEPQAGTACPSMDPTPAMICAACRAYFAWMVSEAEASLDAIVDDYDYEED